MGLQSKMILYAAIGGLLAMMGGFVLYAQQDNPELDKVEISLESVEIIEVNKIENKIKLAVTFLVGNPSEKTFTVPSISFQLYGDGKLIGSGQYSTEDIAMPGRAAFYPNAIIPLDASITISSTQENAEIYQALINDEILAFSTDGVITVETAWSIVEKEFQSSI